VVKAITPLVAALGPCLVTKSIKANIKTLVTYLVKESALKVVQATLDKISNIYNKRV